MAVYLRGSCERRHRHSGQCMTYYYDFTIRRMRYKKAVPEARTQAEAEQAEVAAKREVFEGRYGRPAGGRDFADFVERVYKPWARDNKRSWANEEYCLPAITDYFKGRSFSRFSPLLVEKFKKHLREQRLKCRLRHPHEGDCREGGPLSPRYVNYHLEILFRVFSLAVEHGELSTDDNPCRKVKKLKLSNRRERYLTDEEEPLLMAQAVEPRAHLRDLIIVAVGTGMRLGDQLGLLKRKVDLQRNLIHVPNSKTGRDYQVPMNEEVREVMARLVRENPESEYVFTNPETGRPYAGVRRAFKTACRLAGIDGLRWHDLRHTFGTRLGEAGYSEATIAELMGHASGETTRRYTHGTERSKREAVEAARVVAGGRKTNSRVPSLYQVTGKAAGESG